MVSQYESSPKKNLFPRLSELLFRRGKERMLSTETQGLHEKCAVFGVYVPGTQASSFVYEGLLRLQHRGQDSTGIVSFQNNEMFSHKDEGLVKQTYHDHDLSNLKGSIAVGHNRYGTSGGEGHIQPVISSEHMVALAHNGTLPQVRDLQQFLRKRNVDIVGLNDSELMQRAVEYYMKQKLPLEEAVKRAYPLFTGAFALVIAGEGKLIGVRDKFGIRPLSIGKIEEKGYALSSETVGLDAVKAKFFDEVRPGEMVVIDEKGLQRTQVVKGTSKPDAFEYIYFSDENSVINGIRVGNARQGLGRELAKEQLRLPESQRISADVVVPVPKSSIAYAQGFAPEFGIPSVPGLTIKNGGRTFIHSSVNRAQKVRQKFEVHADLVKGKRVILLDDSIVRGTTARELVKMMRDAGASEVHLFSGSPPVKHRDFYGIDLPTFSELIANKTKGENGLKKYFGADSVRYLSVEGTVKGIGLPRENICLSVFTGKYPIPIGFTNRRALRWAA